jgi:predicted RNA-binding Zn-ribbon protein involved in translation (DUF1610 family)
MSILGAVKSRQDALLGRIAVEKGLVSEAQLKECVRDQMAAPPGTEKPLGVVLLAHGLIGQKQLEELLGEQNLRIRSLDAFQKQQRVEYLFGQLLVKLNKATQIQVNKCLEAQQRMAEKGVSPVPRIGEVLVEHGYITRETVAEILRMQNKELLFCTGCGRQLNIVDLEGGKTYRCRECGGTMVQRARLESLRADETFFGFELPAEEK